MDFTYLVGSISFMFGGVIALSMWKNEHYGLGLIKDLNAVHRDDVAPGEGPEPEEFVLSMQSQYGCGRSSTSQLPWLLMYILNASVSVVNVGLDVVEKRAAFVVASSCINFLLSHGVLMLASVIHHVPTAAPHNWLLIYMRLILLASCVNMCYGVFWQLSLVRD